MFDWESVLYSWIWLGGTLSWVSTWPVTETEIFVFGVSLCWVSREFIHNFCEAREIAIVWEMGILWELISEIVAERLLGFLNVFVGFGVWVLFYRVPFSHTILVNVWLFWHCQLRVFTFQSSGHCLFRAPTWIFIWTIHGFCYFLKVYIFAQAWQGNPVHAVFVTV